MILSFSFSLLRFKNQVFSILVSSVFLVIKVDLYKGELCESTRQDFHTVVHILHSPSFVYSFQALFSFQMFHNVLEEIVGYRRAVTAESLHGERWFACRKRPTSITFIN